MLASAAISELSMHSCGCVGMEQSGIHARCIWILQTIMIDCLLLWTSSEDFDLDPHDFCWSPLVMQVLFNTLSVANPNY